MKFYTFFAQHKFTIQLFLALFFMQSNLPATLLSLEGCTAAGKTTLLTILKKELNAQIIDEPLTRWQNIDGTGSKEANFFDAYLRDLPRWGCTFQMNALTTFAQACTEACKTNNENLLQITDRSIFSAYYCYAEMMYADKTIAPMEKTLCKNLFEFLSSTVQTPDGFIYLRTTPKVCLDRVRKRASEQSDRIVEADAYQLEFFLQHFKHHEAWLVEKKIDNKLIAALPVCVIDGDIDFEKNPVEQQKIVAQVRNFIKQIEDKKSIPVKTCSVQACTAITPPAKNNPAPRLV
jgi:thymidine kinase